MKDLKMATYLGEVPVEQKDTPYADYDANSWALYFVFRYGQIDGAHHKQWVLDQLSRILMGTPLIITKASWDNGEEEYLVNTGEPSQKYLDWVKEYKGKYLEEDECYEYSYDEGIAP